MRAFAINCTLKPSPGASSTDAMLDLIENELEPLGVGLDRVRLVDHRIEPGVTADEGHGDEWPILRQRILHAELFVLATPIWMGHACSEAQKVLERLDAFLGDTDDREQMRTADRVAMVAVVGNEDGAHHVGAELFQGLNDTGFALAPSAMTYWVGEAMQKTDFQDLADVPDAVTQTTHTMVTNAVHLATQLQDRPFPSL